MKPSSSMHCYRWRLVGKPLTLPLYAKTQQSRPESFQTANGSLLEFREKIFPATQDRIVGSCEVLRLGLQC